MRQRALGSVASKYMAYRMERLDVRVPAVAGQLEEAREDAGEARPPRRRLLGQWHGAGAGAVQDARRVQMEGTRGMFFASGRCSITGRTDVVTADLRARCCCYCGLHGGAGC